MTLTRGETENLSKRKSKINGFKRFTLKTFDIK